MSEMNNTVVPSATAPEIGTGTYPLNGENANQQPIVPETEKGGFIGAIMSHGVMYAAGVASGQAIERHRIHKEAKNQKKEEKKAEKAAKPKKRIKFQLPWSVEEYVEVPAEQKAQETEPEAKAE